MNTDYDLIIVGGGLVGASLAIALSSQGLKIALVDTNPPGVKTDRPSYDDRGIALAYGTRRIFEAMHVWDDLAADAEPIKSIHISDRGHFGFSHLSAAQEQVPTLGYVLTARRLGQTLLARLADCADLDIIAPAKVTELDNQPAQVQIQVEQADGQQHQLSAKLLVAADGGKSFVREQLQIPTIRLEYGQTAVVANITPQQLHANCAYERFTETGPVALLPMSENRCKLVWTVLDEQAEVVMGLNDADFIQAFQQRFGYRLGRFQKVGKRQSYPLSLLRARESVRERVAIIGNAAHTLHPIAGQGFNLGIRDVAALVDVMLANRADIGAESALQAYQAWRTGEQRSMARATDGLARLFTNPLSGIRLGRNLGLLALDRLPFVKRRICRSAMGLDGKLPRLARGVSLSQPM